MMMTNKKEDNSQHQDGNESFINTTKEEESFIERLMPYDLD